MHIFTLPKEVQLDFAAILALRPDDRSSIVLFDKDKEEFRPRKIFRSYLCYGKTPTFNEKVKKSYMFLNKEKTIPQELLEAWYYAKSIDPRYNQMVVNFYSPEDYIEKHSDCTSSMINPEAPILTINLNETDDIYSIRHFNVENKATKELKTYPLLNRTAFEFKDNSSSKHWVGKGSQKRISITFRQMR